MRVESIPINLIRPNDWNPNEMDDHIYQSLIESIRKLVTTNGILTKKIADQSHQ
ncbi:hypothetical protein [Paenibacillus periandrae]|uniref:hypothetical protein n=1 Tax=Paenibacillus periandrae TaxID=1761741 RepID=UPI001F09D50D|nr:hypothetical protein [Paenibacillus periandrae]